jgi:hypothetical protein
MAGNNVPDIEIIQPGDISPQGVPTPLPQDTPAGGRRKVRASEVVIIILLVLMVVCCCCACVLVAGSLKLIAAGLAGLFGGGLAVPPLVF